MGTKNFINVFDGQDFVSVSHRFPPGFCAVDVIVDELITRGSGMEGQCGTCVLHMRGFPGFYCCVPGNGLF
ncbi:hypothetical protein D3C78_1933890 [compost metagenome]